MLISWSAVRRIRSQATAGPRWLGASFFTMVRTQFAHQVMAAAIRTPARKFLVSLSYRVAMRRKSLSRQNIRSMRLRLL